MAIDFLNDISFLVEEIIVIGVIGFLTYLMNHYRNRGKDINEMKNTLSNVRGRQIQLQKALILFASLTDEQAKKLHPKEFMEFEGIIKEMLTDTIVTHANSN